MAYATTPDTPRTRPSTVSAAVILLYVVAALELVNAIAAAVNYNAFKSAYEKTYAGTSQASQAGTQAAVAVVGPVVIGIILAIVFVVLAILDGRGSRVGRIITWIVSGLAICCVGSGLALTALGRSFYESAAKQNPDMPPYDVMQRNMTDALPSWYGPVTLIAGIGALIAIILAAILLALPASNAFFRKRVEPEWEPPLPPAGPPAAPPPA